MKRFVLLLSAATLGAAPIGAARAAEACPHAPQRAKQECHNPIDKMQLGGTAGSLSRVVQARAAAASTPAAAAPAANSLPNVQPVVAAPAASAAASLRTVQPVVAAPAPSPAVAVPTQLAPASTRAASVTPMTTGVMRTLNTGVMARPRPAAAPSMPTQKNIRLIVSNAGADVALGLPKERRPY
jgi:hypothetical protein